MARSRKADQIYGMADEFRTRCLVEGRSLLWPEQTAWTTQNISALLDAYIASVNDRLNAQM